MAFEQTWKVISWDVVGGVGGGKVNLYVCEMNYKF